MKSTSMASFSGLYVMKWLSRFLKHMSHRSRSNAKSYEMFYGLSAYIWKMQNAALIITSLKSTNHLLEVLWSRVNPLNHAPFHVLSRSIGL